MVIMSSALILSLCTTLVHKAQLHTKYVEYTSLGFISSLWVWVKSLTTDNLLGDLFLFWNFMRNNRLINTMNALLISLDGDMR